MVKIITWMLHIEQLYLLNQYGITYTEKEMLGIMLNRWVV